MYAGAAREAVFSRPAVIRRIQADFVPLALRATLANGVSGLPADEETPIYQRLRRAMLAPQGIGVLDSQGRVVMWTQMFDDEQSILDFLDRSLKRFREIPSEPSPVVAERYMRFPSDRVQDLASEAEIPSIAKQHVQGKTCSSRIVKGELPAGTLVAHMVGRALDDQGKPLADTVNQEHYAEDQLVVSLDMQKTLTRALAKAADDRVRLPEEFSLLCASHAHLGHIDVRPLLNMAGDPNNPQAVGGQVQNKGKWKDIAFWARKVENRNEHVLWRVEGVSNVVSELAVNGRGVHDIELVWDGFLETRGIQLTKLILRAHGREKLEFAKDEHPLLQTKREEVAFLPGGRPIDLSCSVRYGIIGEPVAPEDIVTAKSTARVEEPTAKGSTKDPRPTTPAPTRPVPQKAADQQLVENLGPQFVVFLDAVQNELRLDENQQAALNQMKSGAQEGLSQFLQQIQQLPESERGEKLGEFRQQANQTISGALAMLLTPEQQKRLRQLVLQREGLFALANPDVAEELNFDGETQKRQLLETLQETRRRFESLQRTAHEVMQRKAQQGANPEEVQKEAARFQREAETIRAEQESKLESLLTDAQKSHWKQMTGRGH